MKIFCRTCKWHKASTWLRDNCYFPSARTYHESPERAFYSEGKCWKRNKNNDCKDYEKQSLSQAIEVWREDNPVAAIGLFVLIGLILMLPVMIWGS